MKNSNRLTNILFCSIAALGLIAAPGSALAQEKGGERLMKLQRVGTAADVQKVQPGDTVVMSCPKCKDTWVKVVQPPGRGGRQEVATVQKHECPGCGTKIETQGVGKQATTTIKHVCTHCGSTDAQCAVLKKGAVSTKAGQEPNEQH